MPTLSSDLTLLASLFDLEQVAYESPNAQSVRQYYKWTNWFYRQFHSKEGAMHFPLYLPAGATNHAEGLAEQARFVATYLTPEKAQNVTEIGCGSGYNLRNLARLYPEVSYQGIDVTPLHIWQASAYTRKAHLRNITFQQGAFSRLPVAQASQDIVFAVESFCYTQNIKHDLAEVARILKQGGKFIVYDVFLQPDFDLASPALQLASRLTAVGFAVADWNRLSDLQQYAKEVGLHMEVCEDLHTTLRPNLLRFQQDTRRLFEKTKLLRLLSQWHILPASWLKHAMTGLLAPYTMHEQVQGYYKIVLTKLDK